MAIKLKDIRDALRAGKGAWFTGSTRGRGRGVLRARVMTNGTIGFWFRYTSSQVIPGKQGTQSTQVQLPLNVIESTGEKSLSNVFKPTEGIDDPRFEREFEEALDKAEAEAKRLSRLHQEHHDLREYLAQVDADKAQRQAEAAKAEAAMSAKSLKALLDAYVAHLKAKGKSSARETENLFAKNVIQPHPGLASKPAKDITQYDVDAILRPLLDAKKNRTAGKVRAFMRSAYALAIKAGNGPKPGEKSEETISATIHAALKGFNIGRLNPVALVEHDDIFDSVPGERKLNDVELRACIKHLEQQQTLAADAILLALYLGGQRPAQLLRVKRENIDLVAGTITMFDPKGRRKMPRTHTLPLTPAALAIVERHLPDDAKAFLFARDVVPLRPEKLSAVIAGISRIMVEDKVAVTPFQLHDIRRTCESILNSRLKVSSDALKHTLSHGFGGVQDKVYQKGDYTDLKADTLAAWTQFLTELTREEPEPTPAEEAPAPPTNVVPLRRPA